MVCNGINAINVLSRIVTFIEDKQQEYSDLTSNCGIIGGGTILNRVPDYAKAVIDIRTLKTDVNVFLDALKQKIEKLEQMYKGTKIKMTQIMEIFPFYEKNQFLINSLADALNVGVYDFSGGCEAGFYQNYSGSAIVFGVGDLALAHKPNEYVEKSEYYEYSKKLIKLIEATSSLFKSVV